MHSLVGKVGYPKKKTPPNVTFFKFIIYIVVVFIVDTVIIDHHTNDGEGLTILA